MCCCRCQSFVFAFGSLQADRIHHVHSMCCQPVIFLHSWKSQEYNFGEKKCKYLLPKGQFSTLRFFSLLTTVPTKSLAPTPCQTTLKSEVNVAQQRAGYPRTFPAGSVHVTAWWAMLVLGCHDSHIHSGSLKFSGSLHCILRPLLLYYTGAMHQPQL